MWKNLTLFVALPAVALGMVNAYLLTQEEEKTVKRPPFIKYDYMYIRNKVKNYLIEKFFVSSKEVQFCYLFLRKKKTFSLFTHAIYQILEFERTEKNILYFSKLNSMWKQFNANIKKLVRIDDGKK